MYKGERIVLIIPAYNEEGKIGNVVRKAKRWSGFLDDVVVINDGSSDRTEEEARNMGATVINHNKNRGVGAALRTGFNYAMKRKYDIIVVAAGDDQDDPSKIKDLIDPIVNEGYDFVQGSRYLGGYKPNLPKFRYITTKSFSLIFSIIAGKKITDATNGFRAFRTYLLKKIDLNKEWMNRYELEPYFMLEVIKRGFKMKEVGVPKYWPEGKSYSKMIPFKSWWSISKPMIYSLLHIKRN